MRIYRGVLVRGVKGVKGVVDFWIEVGKVIDGGV